MIFSILSYPQKSSACKKADAKINVATMNLVQQANFLEKGTFLTSLTPDFRVLNKTEA